MIFLPHLKSTIIHILDARDFQLHLVSVKDGMLTLLCYHAMQEDAVFGFIFSSHTSEKMSGSIFSRGVDEHYFPYRR